MPPPLPNSELRSREFLTPAEVERRLMTAPGATARANRRRDDPALLPARFPGFRALTCVGPRWTSMVIGSMSATTRKAIWRRIRCRAMRCECCGSGCRDWAHSDFEFVSKRGSPFSMSGFAKMVERAGEEAGLGSKAHPHMLRRACAYPLANKGHDTRSFQDWLGHRNIQHTFDIRSWQHPI
jgi:Phage integrase family